MEHQISGCLLKGILAGLGCRQKLKEGEGRKCDLQAGGEEQKGVKGRGGEEEEGEKRTRRLWGLILLEETSPKCPS